MYYATAFRSLYWLRLIVLPTALIIASIALLWALALWKLGYEHLLAMELVNLGTVVAQCFVGTPLAIAIHRQIILGEISTPYALTPWSPRFRIYFEFLLVPAIIYSLGFILCLFGESTSGLGLATSNLAQGLAFLILFQLILFFPAIAVETPTANWRPAARRLQGHRWRACLTLFIMLLPISFLERAVAYFVYRPLVAVDPLWGWLLFPLFPALFSVARLMVFAVVASRFYLELPKAGEMPKTAAAPHSPARHDRRLRNAAGVLLVVGLFVVLRASAFLPIESAVPSSAARVISALYATGVIVEHSDAEALRWHNLAVDRAQRGTQ